MKNCELSTISGSAPGYADGPLSKAKFKSPGPICTTCEGRLLIVADIGNRAIRCIDFETGIVSTLCGVPGAPGKISNNINVKLNKIRFKEISGICASRRHGIIYVSDAGNSCVIEIDFL